MAKSKNLKVTVQPKVAEQAAAVEPVAASVVAPTQPATQPKPAAQAAPQPKPAAAERPRAATAPRKLVSLSDILNGGAEKSEEQAEERVESRVDPRSEELLEGHRAEIMKYIASWRPRFAVPFEAMSFIGHKISVKVPTSELKIEIERSTSELLHRVVEICEIAGLVELEIILDEVVVATRPIKLEDKITHLVNLNPEISKFKERFNLYIE